MTPKKKKIKNNIYIHTHTHYGIIEEIKNVKCLEKNALVLLLHK